MKQLAIAFTLTALLGLTNSPLAATFEGVSLPDHYQLGSRTLQLNGQGMRKKFFFSIYVGALYTPARISTPKEAMNPELPKVIRMHFVYDEVSAEKLRSGFAESINQNTPDFTRTTAAAEFLNLFDFPAKAGEVLDMQFLPGGILAVKHQGKEIGRLNSTALCQAVLSIYFGDHPIESLKEGMLGI